MNSSETHLFRVQGVTFAIALLVSALVALSGPTVALAEAGNMPDLRGIWKTTYAAPTETGRLVRECANGDAGKKVSYSAIKRYPFSRAMDSPLSTE